MSCTCTARHFIVDCLYFCCNVDVGIADNDTMPSKTPCQLESCALAPFGGLLLGNTWAFAVMYA